MLYLTRHIMHQFSRYTAISYTIVLFIKVLLCVNMWRNTSYVSYETYIYVLSQTYTRTTHMMWYATYMPLCGITCTACCILPCHVNSNIIFLKIVWGRKTNCLKSLSHMCNMTYVMFTF